MIHLVSFGTCIEDVDYQDTELRQIRLHESGKKIGIKSHFPYKRSDFVKTDFYQKHKDICDETKGAGYWLWKPYYILETLKKIKDNDFLIYTDNSLYFIEKIDILLDICQKNNGFFLIGMDSGGQISTFTQRSTFVGMDMDTEVYYTHKGTEANFQIYQKNEKTLAFVEEWLSYCCKEHILKENPNFHLPNIEGFKFHKHDMSILSLLRAKYNIEGFRAPYQFGNDNKMPVYRVEGEWLMSGKYKENDIFENSPYPTLLTWDKDGFGVKRPFSHWFNPIKLLGKIRRILKK